MWTRIWQAFLASLDEQGKLEWSRAFLDGSFVPAKRGRRSRPYEGRKGDKRILVVDGNGIPLGLVISQASRAEMRLAQETLAELLQLEIKN